MDHRRVAQVDRRFDRQSDDSADRRPDRGRRQVLPANTTARLVADRWSGDDHAASLYRAAATCGRSLCRRPAVAHVELDTRRFEVRVEAYDPDGVGVRLCQLHADNLTAPSGWAFHDNRPEPVASTGAGDGHDAPLPDVEPGTGLLGRAFRAAL